MQERLLSRLLLLAAPKHRCRAQEWDRLFLDSVDGTACESVNLVPKNTTDSSFSVSNIRDHAFELYLFNARVLAAPVPSLLISRISLVTTCLNLQNHTSKEALVR